jgi:thiol-disulfide isomerase/thioredoxin
MPSIFKLPVLRQLLLASVIPIIASSTLLAQQQKSVTLQGQLVCSLCWFEADRKTTPYGTAADIACAKDCVEKGIPPAIAVREDDGYKLYIVEEGKVRKRTQAWLEFIGMQIEVNGRIRSNNGKAYIAVDNLTVTSESTASTIAKSLIGSQVDLNLKDLFGTDQKISSYFGRILILNFWATWCVPCRAEMSDLVALQNDYAAFGVQVIGASADSLSDRNKALEFIKGNRVNFPVWLGLTTEQMKRFGVGPALPATVILSRDGKILTIYPSVIEGTEVRKFLDKLLAVDALAMTSEIAPAKSSARDISLVPS